MSTLSLDDLFCSLQREYYQAWFRFHPEHAVDVGVSAHAGSLRSYQHDDIGALIALDQKLLSALDEFSSDELSEQLAIDYKVLRGAANIELHELEEQNWRYRNPMEYIPLHAIYQLLTHPVENVHTAIKRRLDAIPEYCRGARVMLQQAPEHVVPVWLQSAVEQCHTGKDFIRNLGRHPLITQRFTNPAKLQPVFDAAANALEEFARFLETDIAVHAQGDFACGQNHFNRLLNERHFLATDADQIIKLGERLFDETRQELLALTKKMQGDEDIPALLKKIQGDHPAAEKLLDVYRERMRSAHRWLEQSDLVSMPQSQSLKVQETPGFLQALIPFAAYDPPSAIDSEQHGHYYVTPPDTDGLREHCYTSINLTCAHEAFPGHHLQFVLANQSNRDNYTRLLNASASLYEGWALYCEQLVIEQGWLNGDEHRFMLLRDRLWRCLRITIDARMQTGKMTQQQAADLLVAELGFEPQQATAEISWYTGAPATPLCYATGAEMLLSARAQIVDKGAASLKSFHDSLLHQGSIALPLIIEQQFGDAVWRRVHTAVLE